MKFRCFEGLDASSNPRNRTRDAWSRRKLHRKLEVMYGLWYSSPVAQRVKCLPAVWETWVLSLGWEDPLEKEMAPHSSILAWKILWTEKPGGLQSMGSQRVEHDWAASLWSVVAPQVMLVVKNPPANAGDVRDAGLISGLRRCPGGGNGNPLQYAFLENPMDRGAWKATVHGIRKSRTQLSNWAHTCLLSPLHFCLELILLCFCVLSQLVWALESFSAVVRSRYTPLALPHRS